MLNVDHVSARYNLLSAYVNAVDDVSFTVRDGEIFGIAGESGCGKSTLLKVLYDLIKYPLELTAGKVVISSSDGRGAARSAATGEISRAWWKDISYVPQGAMHVFNPVVKLKHQFFDAIQKYHAVGSKRRLYDELVDYFREMELAPEALEAYPHQLSGGMRQRALIAMATFLNPSLILADEPTTALDVIVQRSILTMLHRVQRRNGSAMVIVSHDMGVHYQIADKMGIMYAGQMIETGPTEEIFERPRHPYTQMLIGALPRIGDNSQKEGIAGKPPSLKNPPAGCRFADRCGKARPECRTRAPGAVRVGEDHYARCLLLEGGARAEGGMANG